MAKNLKIGEEVYVPVSKIKTLVNYEHALIKRPIVEVNDRSFKIALPNGEVSEWIGSSLAHRSVALFIFSIGDYGTELTLIDPLAKSILQFCRLIYGDDGEVLHRKVRSKEEFEYYWNHELDGYRFVVIIGHGSQDGLYFAVNEDVEAQWFVDLFNGMDMSEKTIISLCCQTGYKSFAGVLSTANCCSTVIAPMQSIHGATGSQFLQNYLVNHLLHGNTSKTAFNNSRENTMGTSTFRLWQNGVLIGGMRGNL